MVPVVAEAGVDFRHHLAMFPGPVGVCLSHKVCNEIRNRVPTCRFSAHGHGNVRT